MKTKVLLGVIIIAAIFCFACSGDAVKYVVGTEANMTALTVGNVRIPQIPEPIDSFDYDDEDFDLSGAPMEIAPLERISDTVAVRFVPTVSHGARVLWGVGSLDTRPFSYSDLRVPATFEDADYIYFKVTSDDGELINYYRFSIWVRSPVVELAEVYIGRYETHDEPTEQGGTNTVVDIDERMMAIVPNGSSDLQTTIVGSPGSISIRKNQSTSAEVIAVPYDSDSKLRYALTTSSSAQPSFDISNTFTLNDQNYLYIEVTAQNTVDIAYYKFRVDVARIATIKSLTFVGAADREFDVVSIGNPNSNWGSTSLMNGKFETADMPGDGFGLEYELDDPLATLSYTLVDNKSGTLPGAFNSAAKVVFNGTNVLGIKVVSDNGQATRYYKIEVVLLATGFLSQPKSDYYYYYNANTKVGSPDATAAAYFEDGTGGQNWYDYAKLNKYKPIYEDDDPEKEIIGEELIVSESLDPAHQNFSDAQHGASSGQAIRALTFVLDRDLTGATYQWYETNSWYGGYGFDADGRILYYEPKNPEAKPEVGFTGGDANNAGTYYVSGFDEKKNVSFHNGGNQFYRLPTKGRAIPDASGTITGTNSGGGADYKPFVKYRPFIDGFTSETHYYWVEITDSTGRKATSSRAYIVSERDPTKKHHIVDLRYGDDGDLWKMDGSNKVYGSARNPKVFTFKRETYRIPMQADGFVYTDYTIAMVQALFWLKDGTPWIQNWTQGDIGFNDGVKDLIYYNLTNNNGTLGLVGGGKEPNGGSLDDTPIEIIVKPAGEKPVTTMPPFDDVEKTKPSSNNDAQGWFTGFIELVEVRFEGPARAD